MTLTKAHIIDMIQEKVGFPRKKSADLIETLLEIMKRNLENDEDILISGFGKFCVKQKSQRKGRNPATGEDMILPKRRVITFKCSSVLRDQVGGEPD